MILKLLEKMGRKRIMPDGAEDVADAYLVRYYLLFKEKMRTLEDNKTNWPFNIYIHNIRRSDPQDLHDHPWPYTTIILKGGYYEHTPEGKFWRGPGHIRTSKATGLHRLEVVKGVDCWTMFMRGKKQRVWGYQTKEKWIPYKDYIVNESVLKEQFKNGE